MSGSVTANTELANLHILMRCDKVIAKQCKDKQFDNIWRGYHAVECPMQYSTAPCVTLVNHMRWLASWNQKAELNNSSECWRHRHINMTLTFDLLPFNPQTNQCIFFPRCTNDKIVVKAINGYCDIAEMYSPEMHWRTDWLTHGQRQISASGAYFVYSRVLQGRHWG